MALDNFEASAKDPEKWHRVPRLTAIKLPNDWAFAKGEYMVQKTKQDKNKTKQNKNKNKNKKTAVRQL